MKFAFSILQIFLAAVLFTACTSTQEQAAALRTPYEPTLVMEYYPYPTWDKALALTGVKPLPAYSGWTDERMERDLDTITDTGCTILLVTMTPQAVSQSLYLTRLKRFYDICQEHSPNVRILLCFTSQSRLLIPLDSLSSFLGQQGLILHPAAYRKDARTAIVFDETITFSGDSAYQDLAILRLGRDLPARPPVLKEERPLKELPALDILDGKAWIRGGHCGRNHDCKQAFWPLPRKNGTLLEHQLEQAARAHVPVLLLSSWNNYSDGSFLEPNTLDKDKLLSILLTIKEL